MTDMQVRLAGSGGQGVILASVILAEAAVLSGANAAQSQSYGPEARGGACKAEVVVSRSPIEFPKVQDPTLLLALTQKAADKYGRETASDAIVILDDGVVPPAGMKAKQIIRAPILRTAKEKTGKAFTANIVAVGVINDVLHLAPPEVIREAVKRHIPKGTEELNLKALSEGEKLFPATSA